MPIRICGALLRPTSAVVHGGADEGNSSNRMAVALRHRAWCRDYRTLRQLVAQPEGKTPGTLSGRLTALIRRLANFLKGARGSNDTKSQEPWWKRRKPY